MEFEEGGLLEDKTREEIMSEENMLEMMDPSGMDNNARKYWEIIRGAICDQQSLGLPSWEVDLCLAVVVMGTIMLLDYHVAFDS
jgi:hypothetical protein